LKVEELSQAPDRSAGRSAVQVDPALHGPAPDVYMKAAAAYLAEMMSNPARVVEHQVELLGQDPEALCRGAADPGQGRIQGPARPRPQGSPLSNPLWDTHPFFNYLKQQYQLNAEAITTAVGDMETLEPADRRRVEYFTRQIVDMFSPTNFLGTNPDALEKAVATDGESLVQGLENLVRDIEANQGDLLVTLADREAFRSGRTSPPPPAQSSTATGCWS
jgi:polyhydroxyalkanoate synthase